MLEYYFKRPRVQTRIRTNALYKQIRKLIYYLHDCGYRPDTIQSYVQKIEHFGNWLKTNGTPVGSINEDTISLFINKHLPKCHCSVPCPCGRKDVRAALNRLLYVLPSRNHKPKKMNITSVDKEIQRFKIYLSDACGLSNSTIHYLARNIKGFLVEIFGKKQIKYKGISPAQIIRYVSEKAKHYKPGSTKAHRPAPASAIFCGTWKYLYKHLSKSERPCRY